MVRKSALLLLVCAAFCSCDSDSKTAKELSELKNDLTTTIEETRKAIDEMTPSREEVKEGTSKEVEKLFTFEYRVFAVPKDLEFAKQEEELALLGKDRWECFDVESTEENLVFYCKRRPKTYLRYVPRVF